LAEFRDYEEYERAAYLHALERFEFGGSEELYERYGLDASEGLPCIACLRPIPSDEPYEIILGGGHRAAVALHKDCLDEYKRRLAVEGFYTWLDLEER
jgi:hypothetical protein